MAIVKRTNVPINTYSPYWLILEKQPYRLFLQLFFHVYQYIRHNCRQTSRRDPG